MLSRNQFLHNRYRIIRPLGKGGFGQVYESLDDKLDCIVAIKERHAEQASDKLLKAFEREAKLLANLRHPVLPKVMDHFFEGGGQYLVMEFIEGDDLSKLLQKRRFPFTHEELFILADEILKALDYLHERDEPIVHRDIKPSNIKITDRGEIFLLDFGLAKGGAGAMPEHKSSSLHGYTAVYAPLEQLNNSGTSGQSDLYALGATLYQLATGRLPLTSAQRYREMEMGNHDPLPTAADVNPNVPSQLSLVLSQAMAVSRRDRLRSASEMRDALNRARLEIEEMQRRMAEETVAAEQATVERKSQAGSLAFPTTPSPTVPSPNLQTPLVSGTQTPFGLPTGHKPEAEAQRPAGQSQPGAQGPQVSWPSKIGSESRDSQWPSSIQDEMPSTVLDDGYEGLVNQGDARQSEEATHLRAEALRQAAEEEQLRAAEEAERRAEAERVRAEAQRRAEEEEEARKKAAEEEELRRRAQEEAEKRAAEEARRAAEEEKRKEEARQRAEEEERKLREAEARRRAEEARQAEEARLAEEARRAEEARLKALEEARQRQIEEERLRVEAEKQRAREEAIRLAREAEAKRVAAEAARRAAPTIIETFPKEGEPARDKPEKAASQATLVYPATDPTATPDTVAAVTETAELQPTLLAHHGLLNLGGGQDGSITPAERKPRGLIIGAIVGLVLLGIIVSAVVLLFSRRSGNENTLAKVDPAQRPATAVPKTASNSGLKQPLNNLSSQTIDKQGGKVWSVVFSPDGRWAASGGEDKLVRIWNSQSWNKTFTLSGHSDQVNSVAFSPDGKTLASGATDKSIRLWNVADGSTIRTLAKHKDRVMSVAFSPDGKTLASGGLDRIIYLWNVSTGEIIGELNGHTNGVLSVAFSPDGATLASAGRDDTLKIWNVRDRKEIKTIQVSKPFVVSFSPNGDMLASGHHSDNSIKLWNWETAAKVRELAGHTGAIESIAFTPDSAQLASASTDKTIRIWDVQTGRVVQTLSNPTGSVESVSFSPDGRALVSGSSDQTVKVWR